VSSFSNSGTPRVVLRPRISINKYALHESAKVIVERKSGRKIRVLSRSFFQLLV